MKTKKVNLRPYRVVASAILCALFPFALLAGEPIQVGYGTMKISGLLQFWYSVDFTSASGRTTVDSARLRRAEIKVSGDINPAVSWWVMFDPAQVKEDDTTTATVSGTKVVTSVGRKSPLQDFGISLKYFPKTTIDVGQFKTPFGMEGLESSAKLDTIERSLIASSLKWADYRDTGGQVKGDYALGSVKIQPTAGFFNGQGQNKGDTNEEKAFAGRLVVIPVNGLHIGGAFYDGKMGTPAASTVNKRTGAELKYTLGPASLKGEYAAGEVNTVRMKTWYATGLYRFLDKWEGVVKYDRLDPNTKVDRNEVSELTLGVTRRIESHNAKWAINYVVRDEDPSVDNDVIRALMQVSF